MKDMKQEMPFLMVKTIKPILLFSTYLIDVNMEMVVNLNMKFLNVEAIIVLFRLKFFFVVKSVNFITGEDYKQQHLKSFYKKKDDQTIGLCLEIKNFVEKIITI